MKSPDMKLFDRSSRIIHLSIDFIPLISFQWLQNGVFLSSHFDYPLPLELNPFFPPLDPTQLALA